MSEIPYSVRSSRQYTNGTGVSLDGVTFSIGQPVGTSDNVQFNDVTVDTLIATRGDFTNGIMPLAIEQNTISATPKNRNVFLYKDQGSNGEYGRLLFGDGLFLYGSTPFGGPPAIELRDGRAGNIYFTGYVAPTLYNASRYYPQVWNGPSDDRLKHNEIIIQNGLNIIRELVPQKYQKTNEMKDPNYNGPLEDGTWKWEAGVIAQDVEKIEELKYLVGPGGFPSEEDVNNGVEYKEYPKTVVYNDLFIYNIAATKELDIIVQEQKNEIDSLKDKNLELENKVDLLKNKLNELLSDAGKEIITF